MGIGTLLLFAFIAIPIVEIWLLIAVGGVIGALPTIGLVVLTAMIGMAMIRAQGTDALRRAQMAVDRGQPPVGPIVDGAFLLVAGALLLTPGFVTDTIGFLCLVPPVRRLAAAWIWSRFGDRITVRGGGEAPRAGSAAGSRRGGPIIEGEFEEIPRPDGDPRSEPGPARRDSPWRGGETE
jgi:UPF0716 protein FxsA